MAYLETGVAPERSVVLTFDDGTKNLWTYVDPVLQEHDFSALAFVIVGAVGDKQPYYLTWSELDRMVQSGRWDIESHAYDGHTWIEVDVESHRGPFMTNLAWLGGEGRVETLTEWRQRVTEDMDASIEALVQHGFPRPQFFAYPFSAVRWPTNDEQIPDVLMSEIGDRFDIAFSNQCPDGPVLTQAVEFGHFARLEVVNGTDAELLFEQLISADLD